jgi:hypothetical protein
VSAQKCTVKVHIRYGVFEFYVANYARARTGQETPPISGFIRFIVPPVVRRLLKILLPKLIHTTQRQEGEGKPVIVVHKALPAPAYKQKILTCFLGYLRGAVTSTNL